jgi:hypothetical protein
VLEAEGVGGPVAGVMSGGEAVDATLREAAALVARYGQGRDGASVTVRAYAPDESWVRVIEVSPAEGARLAELLPKVGE